MKEKMRTFKNQRNDIHLEGGFPSPPGYLFSTHFLQKNDSSEYPTCRFEQDLSLDYPLFTFTGKERDAETGYSYFGARYYDSDLSGLFLSIDPMADKYPSISPYAYCAWNPLKLVDPDGEEIFYRDNTGTYMYKKIDGQYGFYNCKTNEKYSGNNSNFVNNLSDALSTLKVGKHGKALVSFFEGDEVNNVIIGKGDENLNDGAYVSWKDDKKSLIPVALTKDDPIQAEETETFVSLGHELAHVRDRYKHGEKHKNMSLEVKEQSAMLTENFIRREHGFRQRSFYGLDSDGRSVDFSSYKAIMLPLLPTNGIKNKYSIPFFEK